MNNFPIFLDKWLYTPIYTKPKYSDVMIIFYEKHTKKQDQRGEVSKATAYMAKWLSKTSTI